MLTFTYPFGSTCASTDKIEREIIQIVDASNLFIMQDDDDGLYMNIYGLSPSQEKYILDLVGEIPPPEVTHRQAQEQ